MSYFVEGRVAAGPGLWGLARSLPDAVTLALMWLSTSQAVSVTITNMSGELVAAA